MFRGNHRSQTRIIQSHPCYSLIMNEMYTAPPPPPSISSVELTCFGQWDASRHEIRSLKCACMTRPPACTLAKTMKRAHPGQPAGQSMRRVEQTWNPPIAWIQAQPNLLDQPNPNQSAQAREKINVFF